MSLNRSSPELRWLRLLTSFTGSDFRWKEPPYEYVYDRNPFDVIAGTSSIREAFEQGSTIEEIEKTWAVPFDDFIKVRERYLLY